MTSGKVDLMLSVCSIMYISIKKKIGRVENAVELRLSGLIWTASHPDMQKKSG